MTPIRPPRLQQGSVTRHRTNHTVSHASRTRRTSFYRVGTVALPLTRGRSPVTHVKSCVPLETIKGEPGSHARHGQQSTQSRLKQHTNTTPSEFTHRVASRALSTTQSQDLGLSPLSRPACTPLLQAPLGARQYRPSISHWT